MPVSLATIARSLDTPAELGPHLAELFGLLTSLGGQPRVIVSMLRSAGIGRGSHILDLACGKGAASIAAAKTLGCRSFGVDAYPPFIDEAKKAAERAGVGRLCRFVVGDAARFEVRPARERYDAAMMISLWPLERAARVLRRLVRPGGRYIIDDAVLMPGAPARFRRAGLRTADEVRDRITSLGDLVERERIDSAADSLRHADRLHARLVRGCDALARHDPALRPALRRLLAQQRAAIDDLCGPLRPAIWLVRRGASDSSKTQSRILPKTRTTRSRL